MKRVLMAILVALVLTVGVVGTAFAEQPGVWIRGITVIRPMEQPGVWIR